MAYQYSAITTISKVGGAELSETDKYMSLVVIGKRLYDDTSLDLEQLRQTVKFSTTHIILDADFKVSVVHPVLWTPLLPKVPYIIIQSPADKSTEVWDRCAWFIHTTGHSDDGLRHCAVRIYDISDPSKTKTYPPSLILYNGKTENVGDYGFQRDVVNDRAFEMGKLREESRREYMQALGLTLEDAENNIEALEAAKAALPGGTVRCR